MTKKHVVLDSQLLSTLMSCERLFDFRFNHNLVPIGGRGNALEAGLLLHKMLEVYYSTLAQQSWANSVDAALQAGHLYIRNESDASSIQAEDVKYKNGQLQYIGWKHVLSTFQEYVDYYRADAWTPLYTEKVLSKVIYDDDDLAVMWKAKLDLGVDTNQGIYPVDHKTMKQRRDSVSLNSQFMGQCIVTGARSVIINKIGWQTSLEPKDKFIRVMMNYSAARLVEQIDIIVYYARYLVSLIESGYYPPRYSFCDKYNGCIFRIICEADPSMRLEELNLKFKVGESWDISDSEE